MRLKNGSNQSNSYTFFHIFSIFYDKKNKMKNSTILFFIIFGNFLLVKIPFVGIIQPRKNILSMTIDTNN